MHCVAATAALAAHALTPAAAAAAHTVVSRVATPPAPGTAFGYIAEAGAQAVPRLSTQSTNCS